MPASAGSAPVREAATTAAGGCRRAGRGRVRGSGSIASLGRVTQATQQPLHRALGLTDAEYKQIEKALERSPNDFELAVYSLLWSEHCGYKHSRLELRRLPTNGPRVLQGPGENAGVIDVGDGLAVAFKVESHNHPSAVEPYQGAATGVGGILRDIFAMGARPIALGDSLRLGPLDEERPRELFRGIVRGIGGYGNCVGVPNVAGETVFDAAYRHNPLVNALCIGLLRADALVRASATGPATWSCSSAPRPGATASAARASWPRRISTRPTPTSARRCRSAIRSRARS